MWQRDWGQRWTQITRLEHLFWGGFQNSKSPVMPWGFETFGLWGGGRGGRGFGAKVYARRYRKGHIIPHSVTLFGIKTGVSLGRNTSYSSPGGKEGQLHIFSCAISSTLHIEYIRFLSKICTCTIRTCCIAFLRFYRELITQTCSPFRVYVGYGEHLHKCTST